jgi:GLPGLI family protein
MKNFLYFPLFLLSFSVLAQTNGIENQVPGQTVQGVITYEVRVDVHSQLPEQFENMKSMIPQFNVENFSVVFSPASTFFKKVEEPGARRGMMMGGMRTEVFVDRENRQVVDFKDFVGTPFLIEEPIEVIPWKFGFEELEIAGYVCMMAYYNDTIAKQEITAWFTTALPAFMGPDRFVTLPGTILALDINNGETVYVARKIEFREVKAAEIVRPTKGKKMTRKEFDEFLEEQMARFGRRN